MIEDLPFEPLGTLDEDAVKRRFIPFLKDFYRHRYEPVPGSMEVRFDNISQEGLVADGILQFMKPDGQKFICAYEATSKAKTEEVTYTTNINYFLWDCAAFASVATAVIYLANYVTQLPWLIALSWTGNIGLITGIWMISFLGWYFTMRQWKKYRFIYAIAQFDRYEADDQWVALAEDVFPAPTNPYLIELKNQCIFRGYGLAVVPADGPVRVLVAPSRLDEFGKNRKVVEWFTEQQWYQKVQTVTRYRSTGGISALGTKIMQPIQRLLANPLKKYTGNVFHKPLDYTTTAYTQWMSGRVIQKWIFLAGLVLVLPFMQKVLTYRATEIDDLSPRRAILGKNPEDIPNDLYLSDVEPVPYRRDITGVTKQFPEKNTSENTEWPTQTRQQTAGIEEEGVQTISLSGNDDPAPEKLATASTVPKKKTTIKKATKPMVYAGPDYCSLLRRNSGWILQDNAYATKENANLRSTAIQGKGITAVSVAHSCIEKNATGYIVWVGGIYPDESKAKAAQRSYEATMKRGKIYRNKLIIKKL
jgi:hypothetical protein